MLNIIVEFIMLSFGGSKCSAFAVKMNVVFGRDVILFKGVVVYECYETERRPMTR